jgi:hypothetical protein
MWLIQANSRVQFPLRPEEVAMTLNYLRWQSMMYDVVLLKRELLPPWGNIISNTLPSVG